MEVAPAITPESSVTVPSNVIACPAVGGIASVEAPADEIVFPLIVMSSAVNVVSVPSEVTFGCVAVERVIGCEADQVHALAMVGVPATVPERVGPGIPSPLGSVVDRLGTLAPLVTSTEEAAPAMRASCVEDEA